jgi:hypothetical protein
MLPLNEVVNMHAKVEYLWFQEKKVNYIWQINKRVRIFSYPSNPSEKKYFSIQILQRFSILIFTFFIMDLDIYTFVEINNNNYEFKFAKTNHNLKRREKRVLWLHICIIHGAGMRKYQAD